MYYVLDRSWADHPARVMDDVPFFEDIDFDLGERISARVPQPLRFKLEPLDPNANDVGPDMPEFFDESVPLFREDLIAAMQEAGVDNLDLYDAVIYDPDTKKRYTNYKAVNIIGAIAAADMSKSKATVHPGGPVIDVEFDELVLDETRTGGVLIFRLAEATGTILVHERLRDHLLAKGFTALEFLDPRDVAI
jgi:hypothetical protein